MGDINKDSGIINNSKDTSRLTQGSSVNDSVNRLIDLGGFSVSPERDDQFSEKWGDRYDKYKKLIELGIEVHPAKFDITSKSTYIENIGSDLPLSSEINDEHTSVALAGRILSLRDHGKSVFIDLQDSYGRIQIFMKKDRMSDIEKSVLDLLDTGDFIGIYGVPFKTQRGQPSVYTTEMKFLGKSLLPLPDKHQGVQDKETLYRQPYLDTITNQESRDKFILRSKAIFEIRRFMNDHGFIEIETPILGNKAGGALASSFETYHNALGIPLQLRIAPEIDLKKAVVGGFEKVFEIGKQFRNEGRSANHLQEFTSMEFYWSYVDKDKLMDFTQELCLDILEATKGSSVISYLGEDIDFAGEWPRYSLRDLIYDNSSIDIDKYPTTAELIQEVLSAGINIDIPEAVSRGNLIDLIYKKVARPGLIQPCFVTDHPIDVSPLARRNDTNSNNTDRFQLVINGIEIVNAYGELVDPIDQRLRFEDQAQSKQQGDDEAHDMDEEYLTAMEHGMPPISGWGIGIDRFIAMVTDQENLKDVVMFPLNRPKK